MSKSIVRLFIAVVAVSVFSVGQLSAQSKKKAHPSRKSSSAVSKSLDSAIRDYLLRNPEVIREAMQALQLKEVTQKQLAAAENLKRLSTEIYSSPDSPVAGSEKGDVSVVVFYDYFCGYCRKSLPALQSLVAKDSSVRVVFKELPILGPQSFVAAKAALAAQRQGQFAQFHQALLESDSASDEAIKSISEKLSLDYQKLQGDMNDPEIAAMLDRNQKLAAALNIEGTPAYLVGGQIIPGAIDSESLLKIVASERSKLTTAKN
jgi:protein-disulfide isomerase